MYFYSEQLLEASNSGINLQIGLIRPYGLWIAATLCGWNAADAIKYLQNVSTYSTG